MPALGEMRLHLLSFVLVGSSLAAFGCGAETSSETDLRQQDLPQTKLVISQRAEFSADYPCQDCHNKIEVSELVPDKIKKHRGLKFKHFPGVENCFTCHDKDNRNALSLLTGDKVAFGDSHLLCGQCHMEKVEDWKIGAHGKHMGGWRGVKHRDECADCHNPHSPGRESMIALPAPPIPKFAIPKGGH